MNTTLKNITANYLGRFWGFISGYVFIPFYIHFLGVEAQGVISFSAMLIAFMSLADAGLTSALSREVARFENKKYISNLVNTVEKIYVWICMAVFSVVLILSGTIAKNFLKAENLTLSDLTNFVWMMGLSASFQMFTSMYNGGLTGLQKQVLNNTLGVSYSIFRSVFGLIIVYFVPNLYAYFIWNIFSSIIYFLVTRYFLWKSIKNENNPVFDIKILKNIWRFASGMMIMTFIAVSNTQIDKLLVGKFLSLKEFAYYSIASILGQVSLLLTMPIVIAILPKMTQLVEQQRIGELKKVFHNYSFIISSIACSFSVVLFFYTRELVFFWIGKHEIANSIDIVTKILLLGGLFLTFQFMPYYLSVANGHTKTNVKLGIFALFLVIPAVYLFVTNMGLIGVGIPWAILNFTFFIILGIVLIKKFLKGETALWFKYDVFLPLSVSSIVGIAIYSINASSENVYVLGLKSSLTGILSLILSLIIYNKTFNEYRIDILKYTKAWKHQ